MKQTAQGLAALGRGPDTQLVHMAPSEVAGLQALAMKHGGSLTINPDTGLPEAGFLSSILPMVIGAGITAATGGAAAPWMIGLGVGGVQAARTGSLEKGLMAGLGAYGGAGLAGGLMTAGTGALSSAAIPTAEAVVPQAAVAGSEGLAGVAQTAGQTAGTTGMQELAGVPGKFVTSALPAAPTVPAINAAQLVPTVTQAPALSQSAADIGNAYAQEQAAQNAVGKALSTATPTQTLGAGLTAAGNAPGAFLKANAYPLGAMGISALGSMGPEGSGAGPAQTPSLIRPYTYSREKIPSAFEDVAGAPYSSKERQYFNDQYTALTPYRAPGAEYMAAGGPVEDMSNANALGASTGYPQADIRTGAYSNPFQQPMGQNVVTGSQDAAVNPYTGQAQFAAGGNVNDQYNLGGYSDGGRLLRGPGDGVSDDIPAMIGKKQQARLADGEFVVPARIVSELGNGSTEAGARQLYAMMDRVQKNRKKSMGKGKVAADSKSSKLLPA